MIQALSAPVSFDEFIAWYPEDSDTRYELRRGVIVEMPQPRGKHSDVAGFLIVKLGAAIEAEQLPYFTPKECVIKADEGESAYEPDAVILDRQCIAHEPNWEKSSVIEQGTSVKLIIYTLVEGEYQLQQLRESDRLISPTFPDLTLTVEQVFGVEANL